MPLPPEWALSEDVRPGVCLTVAEPVNELTFRANLVVTVEPVTSDIDLEAWQEVTGSALADSLERYILLDYEVDTSGPYAMVRRLAHHESNGEYSVTMEQWAMLERGYGYTVTFSVGTFAYDDYADLIAKAAAGFVPGQPQVQEGS